MSKSLAEAARMILEGTANAETLKPKSGPSDSPQSLGSADEIADAPVKPGDGENVGAKAAVKAKDNSIKSSVSGEPMKKLAEEEVDENVEVNPDEQLEEDEDIELSEELVEFIDALVAEGLSEEEIEAAIAENFEIIEEEVETIEEEEAFEPVKVDMSEDVEALLAGENLSEEFKTKAEAIFEAAVNRKLAEEVARIEAEYAEMLDEAVQKIQEQMASDVDDYLNYVAEEWVAENEVAIESSLRSELTEDFINGLRNVFMEHYIDIPEDKVSIVEELGAKVESLEEKLNEEIDRNIKLNKVLAESKKLNILGEAIEGLTTTQAEKLKSLAESIKFTSEEEYTSKVTALRESYFNAPVKSENALDKAESADNGPAMIAEDSRMDKYVRVLGKSLPK